MEPNAGRHDTRWQIDVMLPTQYLRGVESSAAEPHKRLMAAVLQTVLDDCRGSAYRRARGYRRGIARRVVRKATAYVASTDRTWPFSFENLCEALGLDASRLRRELETIPASAFPAVGASALVKLPFSAPAPPPGAAETLENPPTLGLNGRNPVLG